MVEGQLYKRLHILDDFAEVCNFSNYVKLPDDWYIVVADITNSTIAIKSGRYKAVNFIGVSVISSILNLTDKDDIPYIFGGDGASICIPEYLVSQSKLALLATRELAKNEFDIELRIGIVSVKSIREAGKNILVAKHKVSKYCVQAAFAGGGIEYAESLLKNNDNRIDNLTDYEIDTPVADYSGLECRWDNVPSIHGETISLIVKALMSPLDEQSQFYSSVIEKISQIYGDDQFCRPVAKQSLRFTFDNNKLELETKIRSIGFGKLTYIKKWLFIRVQMIIGLLLMKFEINIGGIKWGQYKNDTVTNTDFKKFDGVLRFVISGTPQQRKQLDDFLRAQFEMNKCVYGIHYSESAFITCLINNRSENHYHFVDGADGGYAIAATQMKSQLKEINI